MTKISATNGQQRLRKLVQNQLGSNISAKATVVSQTTPTVSTSQFSVKHQQLVARSGAPGNGSTLSLAQRSERRLQMLQERQQQNLESIMALAVDYCPEHVSSQEIDPDWFQQYSLLVLDISNSNMQQLWAKILAGEIATPGRFSLKTLQTLKQMSNKEAQALQQAANLSIRNRQQQARIYFGYFRKPSLWQWLTGRSRAMLNLSQYGLSYPQVLSLMDIGILHSSEIESGELQPGQQLSMQYHQQFFESRITSKGIVLQYYKYTATGAELLPLLTCQPNSGYLSALKQLYASVMQFPS